MEMYMVGGAARDELLGVKSNDIDFTVVLDQDDAFLLNRLGPFATMSHNLSSLGFKIFLETPEYLTIRAQFPKGWITQKDSPYRGNHTTTADFVLARKEGVYTDGRRPDAVEVGTLMDDLQRRDFSMNAIAKAADGSLIDPFGGQADIQAGIIRAVGDPFERLTEDALRAVRALRFSVTKGFTLDDELSEVLESSYEVFDALENKISDERIQVELSKMFRFDTLLSINLLNRFPLLTEAMFAGKVSLDATLKMKGRGNGKSVD